jgi:hypothetical protein
MELNALGFRSPWAFLWYFLFFVAPLAYIYIGLMLLRDLCEYFPESIQQPLQRYAPFLAKVATLMKSYYGFRLVDVWCVIEALFFIACKLKITYLQSKDPLEASLTAAPMLDPDERKILWEHMMEADSDPVWITEWFLDNPSFDSISRYDIFDFICWAMFDARNQEHLTTQELQDLESFVEDLEYRISLHLYGEATASATSLVEQVVEEEDTDLVAENDENDDCDDDNDTSMIAGNRDSLNSSVAMGKQSLSLHASETKCEVESQVYSSPVRSARNASYNEGSTHDSGSFDDWSSLSSRRPRPKQCKDHFAKITNLCAIQECKISF